jgi:hypothetical protein
MVYLGMHVVDSYNDLNFHFNFFVNFSNVVFQIMTNETIDQIIFGLPKDDDICSFYAHSIKWMG